MIEPTWIAGLGAFLFCIGLVGVFTRKNAIIVLMCIEIMLNAVNLNFVAGAMHYNNIDGWVFTSVAIAIAAAEVAVGLAIFLALYSKRGTISLDEVTLLKHKGGHVWENTAKQNGTYCYRFWPWFPSLESAWPWASKRLRALS